MNPHNMLTALEPPTTDPNRQWLCNYCGEHGSWEEVNAVPCKYIYPRCQSCGQVPFCARDCGKPNLWRRFMRWVS